MLELDWEDNEKATGVRIAGTPYYTTLITNLFLNLNINPLDYMEEVPSFFLGYPADDDIKL